jgi:type III secretion protein C
MIMVKRFFPIMILLLGVLFNLSHLAQAQQDSDIQQISPTDCQRWRDGAIITKTTHEEDIRDTLKSIATVNRTPITFGEGIDFKVTVQFKRTPLETAFESLINNYGLAYFWDGCSVHVFNPEMRTTKDVLIRLERLRINEVKGALKRFGLLKKEIKIVFDPHTHTILLTGTEREIENIQDVIHVLESAKEKKVQIRPRIRYYPLTYSKVDDTEITVGKRTVTVKGLVTVLTEVLHLSRVGEKREIEVIPGAGKGKKREPPEEYGAISGVLASQAIVMKKMIEAEAGTIASDSRTNQIIIRDYPDKLDEYGEMIKQLDQPMKMVKLSITIVEASKDFAREFGAGISGFYAKSSHQQPAGGTSGASRQVIDEVRSPFPPQTDTLIPLLDSAAGKAIPQFGLAGTFLYLGNQSALAFTLQATEVKGISRTINSSNIITMDNMQAIVEAKNIVTFKIQTGGVNPVVEDRQIEAGLELRVTPHIIETDDGKTMVEMVVEAERSTFLAATVDGIPEKATTDMSTQAVIGDQGTVIIGGFFENRYAVGETGVPCLMGVPGLGYFFKATSAANPKTNILFFLTPQVISLENIPYEGPELRETVKRYEEELQEIDPQKGDKLIEKYQDY